MCFNVKQKVPGYLPTPSTMNNFPQKNSRYKCNGFTLLRRAIRRRNTRSRLLL